MVGWNKTILRTTDAGASWISQPVYTTYGTNIYFSGVSFGSSTTGFIVGIKDTLRDPNDGRSTFTESMIWRTTNGGASWSRILVGTGVWLYEVGFSSLTAATIVGDGGTILRTTDNGTTWLPSTRVSGL